jgi:hypothetical protein
MDDALSSLLATLPKHVAPERGLLDSLSAIGVRDASRPSHLTAAGGGGSASAQLLAEKQQRAAADSAAMPFAVAPSAPKATNPLHDSLVAGHKANMAEILARKPGNRQKNKTQRGNHKATRTKEKGESYSERASAKVGGRDKRSQRLGAFKKIY